ncbi:MAG: ABC transporter ATP-binding protein [Puniceicoccales bacterium]|jgi:peptide/nickel transport system ATP-binding protein|nr:ABC transporter ATP-binding protein [Puniceicoccales bacterium]
MSHQASAKSMPGFPLAGNDAPATSPISPPQALLEVRDLCVTFQARNGAPPTHAVRGIGYTLGRGRALAIVGESGSGKSAAAHALTRLLPPPPACRITGKVLFNGEDLLELSPRHLRQRRGRHIAYVFQDPSTALNPAFTIGAQIAETIRTHFPSRRDTRELVIQALENVGIRDPRERCHAYPHELSGGMRQRVMLALALVCNPSLLIADEPTTALDVTIQKQILDLIDTLRAKTAMALLLITHNLGIIADHADDLLVVRDGEIVERGPVREILATPRHPYTRALLDAIPRLHTRPEPNREQPEGDDVNTPANG